jgi:predicted negative regulator of RcsB-dependent stress response
VCSSLILLGDAFAKTNDLVSAKDAWNKVIENFTDKKYVDIAKQRLATTK